ncbi:MAG: DUF2213 domain-containing protein [Methylocystis sp.]|uniref:DUF2213 domain-containing protein n=1 Tax=Methylocystis sp. TaxID=1911079 RepID=UPI003DA39987
MSNAAGIMYETDGRVLLVLRSADSEQGGTWAFPGGKIEAHETPEQAARRESFEEVGHNPTGEMRQISDDGNFVTYKICGERFTPILNSEHTSAKWATRDALPSPLHPGVMEIIEANMSARKPDINGFIEIKNNPISKAGVFPYSGRMIGGNADPNKVYNVYRPVEELSDPAAIESFKLIPFVDDHPSDMLGSEEYDLPNVDGKPADGVIGENVYVDGDTLYANVKFFTDRIARAINAGKKEVSAGFRCLYDYAPGVFNGQAYDYIQRKIRGNHVALVNQGRMGPEVAVLDHFKMTFDSKELVKMAENTEVENKEATADADMTMADATKMLEGIVPQVAKLVETLSKLGNPTAAAAPAAAVEDTDKPAEPALDTEMPTKAMDALDKLNKNLTALNATIQTSLAAKGKALDAKDVFASLAKRDALYGSVSKLTGAFDHAELDDVGVAKYALDKFEITAPAGAEVAVVEAYVAAAGKHSERGFVPKGKGLDAASTEPSPIRKHVAG